MISGAQLMIKALENEGVSVVFGYPGAAICPFFDELSNSKIIRSVLVRQEQNAGHSASGYARQTGDVGVCAVTSGPGATNLITAIATAYLDSVPIVAITGQVKTNLIGKDSFQEADITGACEPFSKHSYLVSDTEQLPRIIKEAFHIARTGRPGPVLIDVPMDVQQNLLTSTPKDMPIDIIGYKPSVNANALQIKRALDIIVSAKKPLILSGGGVFLSKSAKERMKTLVEKTSVPQVCTMMGLGVLPTDHELNLGMIGMHGVRSANKALAAADVLIVCGARLGDRSLPNADNILKTAKIIHIDVDPAEIGKTSGVTVPIVGDIATVLEEMLNQLDYITPLDWANICKDSKMSNSHSEGKGRLDPKLFVSSLSKKLSDDCIYVADVGQNQIWSANHHSIKNGRFFTSGGMGTMGYSIPAAIGAKSADVTKQVVAVCGDGSFQMQMMELATMIQHNLPLKIVVITNGNLGMVRELQDKMYAGRHAIVGLEGSPKITKIAEAYGVNAMSIDSNEQIDSAIDSMLKNNGAFLLECVVSPEERSL